MPPKSPLNARWPRASFLSCSSATLRIPRYPAAIPKKSLPPPSAQNPFGLSPAHFTPPPSVINPKNLSFVCCISSRNYPPCPDLSCQSVRPVRQLQRSVSLVLFPFFAQSPHRPPHPHSPRGDGRQALLPRFRQFQLLSFHRHQQQLRIPQNSRQRIVQFVPQHFSEIPAVAVCALRRLRLPTGSGRRRWASVPPQSQPFSSVVLIVSHHVIHFPWRVLSPMLLGSPPHSLFAPINFGRSRSIPPLETVWLLAAGGIAAENPVCAAKSGPRSRTALFRRADCLAAIARGKNFVRPSPAFSDRRSAGRIFPVLRVAAPILHSIPHPRAFLPLARHLLSGRRQSVHPLPPEFGSIPFLQHFLLPPVLPAAQSLLLLSAHYPTARFPLPPFPRLAVPPRIARPLLLCSVAQPFPRAGAQMPAQWTVPGPFLFPGPW